MRIAMFSALEQPGMILITIQKFVCTLFAPFIPH